MQLKWRVKDLIDLEYFLGQAAEHLTSAGPSEGLSPDRKFYLEYEKTVPPPLSRREILRHWLEVKRKTAATGVSDSQRLPGTVYAETISLLSILIIISSFFSGALLSWSVLSYSGKSPINIFSCMWIFIFPQFFLLLLLGISLALARINGSCSGKSVYRVISSLFRYLSGRLKLSGGHRLSATQRIRLNAFSGLMGRYKTLYGSVFFWPVFILAQVFGVCFNLGLLTAALLKLTIADLAFGWQSTLLASPESVLRIAKFLSIPWSWLPMAHPGITQIKGSQIILKEGMSHLMTPDLVSWWPFLCYAIIFYGLIPRLILLLTGIYRQHVALSRVTFSHSACDRLIQRMRAPEIQSSGRDYTSVAGKPIPPTSRDANMVPEEAHAEDVRVEAIVLVPEDLDTQFAHADLRDRVQNLFGLAVLRRIGIELDPDKDMATIENVLRKIPKPIKEIRIVIIVEAWQPPIRETRSWLKHLRHTVGKDTGIIVALTGKPAGRMFFTSPNNTDRVIWEQTINGLGDPFIRVENLGGS